MGTSGLPPEMVSLIHHTELNKAGWWNKTIQQLILSVLWLSGEPLSTSGLVENLRKILHIDVDPMRVSTQVEQMLKSGALVPLSKGYLKISETARRKLDEEIAQTDELTARVRKRFTNCLANSCPSLTANQEWERFNTEFIQPLVQETGARTYELISGTQLDLEKTAHFPAYLSNYGQEHRQGLRTALVEFLDPRNGDVRSFVLRHLNAYFCVEAGNLTAETVDSLMRMVGRPPTFKVFVDTNFLFSFLELHENPSNDAAKSLVALTRQLEGKAACKFYVSPETLDEFKRVVRAENDFLRGLALPPNLASVALELDLDGIARKFVELSAKAGHPVDANTYFEPYLSDLIPTLRNKDVDLFNDSMDGYSLRQDVIDDITVQLEFEKRRFGHKARNYGQLRHDIVLWHFVSDKRPVRVESPVEATYWIVTVDYHYLGFDEFKRRKTDDAIPLCLHPTSLIQMLQFWLPRTEEFEQAVLDSLRLPLLFQQFDTASEEVTIRILGTLARFENADQLPPEVAGKILLSRALRQELALEPDYQKQVDLIRDAIIEESRRVYFELRETLADRDRLAKALADHEREINELKQRLIAVDDPNQGPQSPVSHREGQEPAVEAPIGHNTSREPYYFTAVAFLSLGLFCAATAAGLVIWRPKSGILSVGLVTWCAGGLLWGTLVNRYGAMNESVRSWTPFQKFVKYRKELIGIIAFAVVWDAWESLKDVVLDLFRKMFN